jgi:hypothetical protein
VADEIWNRQPGESAIAFLAFKAYLGLPVGKRSIDAAAQVVGLVKAAEGRRKRAPGRVWAWSAKHEWVERSAAFDAHVDAEDNATLISERKAWRKHQRQLTHALSMRLTGALAKTDFSSLNPSQLVYTLRSIIALRNAALGLDRPEADGAGDRPAGAVTETVPPNLDRFELHPDILAAASLVLSNHEWRTEPAVEQLDSTGEPPASADPGGEIEHHASDAIATQVENES